MIEILLGIQLLVAVLAVTVRRTLAEVLALSLFSLLSALLFYLLDAPDVALTEAAVGAGIGAVIFVWAIHAIRRQEGE
ncbi:MAG: hydrogenase subunit MbhD domain-containing protein [Alkalispirochaetaceae bacterium]